MKFQHLLRRLFILFTVIVITSCAPRAATPPAADLDFTAIADEGYAFLFHLDGQGKASRTPIDFLKGESFYNWDMNSLDELVIAKMAGREVDKAWDIKYYKNKTLARSFRISDVTIIPWIILLPEKKCAIFEADGSDIRLGRIDLISGEEKFVQLATTEIRFPQINSKPVWDKTKGKLTIVLTDKKSEKLYDSLAHLNVDDLTITDVVALNGTPIDALLYVDTTGQHVTAYGMIGGEPLLLPRSGAPGFIEFDVATGNATMIMKDAMRGDFLYEHRGIAVIDHRFVIMTKAPNEPLDFSGYRSYCVDLQEKKIVQLSGVAAFAYPNSHDGLLINPHPQSPATPKKQFPISN